MKRRKQVQIVRPDENGEIDDVSITCDLFRMERLDDGVWWIGVYRGNERVCFSLFRKKKEVKAVLGEDDFGCVDDTPKEIG